MKMELEEGNLITTLCVCVCSCGSGPGLKPIIQIDKIGLCAYGAHVTPKQTSLKQLVVTSSQPCQLFLGAVLQSWQHQYSAQHSCMVSEGHSKDGGPLPECSALGPTTPGASPDHHHPCLGISEEDLAAPHAISLGE